MSGERTKVDIAGFTVERDVNEGSDLWAGAPATTMWIASTVAGLRAGLRRMVGTERFDLSLQQSVRSRSRSAFLDARVEIAGTGTAHHHLRVVRAVELLCFSCWPRAGVSGIRPRIASAMASLGVDLASISTLRNLQEGLKSCMRSIEQEGAKA